MFNILQTVLRFLDSNFFVGFVTLIVGGFAIFLYFKQKEDKKREIARLILQEIRYAEDMLKEYKRHYQYKLSDKLLPTNNWNNNIYMFVSDFSETDIDSISKFYSMISYIDIVIQKISDQKNDPEVIKRITEEIEKAKTTGQVGDVINIQDVSVMSGQILRDTSLSVEYLYNTPAAEKLRNLSNKKWNQLV
ncbi:MAG: hypothetical protein Q8P06_00700 [Candidatus Azambacteria bacterium]|nr:hypothetical protein [Candidatus Azambacteria bacterium]